MLASPNENSEKSLFPTVHLRPGEILIREGEPGHSAYIIQKGTLEVVQSSERGSIVLAQLGPGESVGEMGLVDDIPHNSTVRAMEHTEVWEVKQNHFHLGFSQHPGKSLQILQRLMERLRQANSTILRLQEKTAVRPGHPLATYTNIHYPTRLGHTIKMAGLSHLALESLPHGGILLQKYPFLIGRYDPDPLVHNHLVLNDTVPWQVSRHHLAIIEEHGHMGVLDRGSHHGFILNGQSAGGRLKENRVLFLLPGRNELIIGSRSSPFKFELQYIG